MSEEFRTFAQVFLGMLLVGGFISIGFLSIIASSLDKIARYLGFMLDEMQKEKTQ